MRDEVTMSGLGGQGVLLAGQLLAQAACDAGLLVSRFPSYSPEVRGGWTNCTVVMSDDRAGSPVSGRPKAMVLMEPGAIRAHSDAVADGGVLIVNTSLGEVEIERKDARVVRVAATDEAIAVGSEKVANMVALGAYLQTCRPDMLQPVITALKKILPERHHKLLPMNEQAIRTGAEAAQRALAEA